MTSSSTLISKPVSVFTQNMTRSGYDTQETKPDFDHSIPFYICIHTS